MDTWHSYGILQYIGIVDVLGWISFLNTQEIRQHANHFLICISHSSVHHLCPMLSLFRPPLKSSCIWRILNSGKLFDSHPDKLATIVLGFDFYYLLPHVIVITVGKEVILHKISFKHNFFCTQTVF